MSRRRTLSGVLALLVLGLALVAPALAQMRLPDPETALADPGMEKLAGLLFARRFEKGLRGTPPEILPADAPDTVATAAVVERLAAAVRPERPSMEFRVKVVRDPDVNAFCIPAGHIYVFTGLLDHLRKTQPPGGFEDALAVVLGHEIAHAALRHSLQNWAESGEVRDVLADPSLFEKVVLASSRDQELEADRYGALYAVRAGYRFSAAVEVFQNFPSTRRLYGGGGSTHPETAERVRNLEKYREQLRGLVALWDEANRAAAAGAFEQARVGLEILKAEFPNLGSVRNNLGWVLYAQYEQSRPGGPRNPQQVACDLVPDLGIALRALPGDGDLATLREARREFEECLRLQSDRLEALEGAALCALEWDEPARAAELVARGLERAPDRPALRNLQGVLLERNQDLAGAREAYGKCGSYGPAVYNLARLEQDAGNPAEALTRYRQYLAGGATGVWADRARRALGKLGEASAASAAAPAQVADASGTETLQGILDRYGPPAERQALASGSEQLAYPALGLRCWAREGRLTMLSWGPPAREPVPGLELGMKEAEVLARLGAPAATAPGPGVVFWSYPARGLSLGMQDGVLSEVVVRRGGR